MAAYHDFVTFARPRVRRPIADHLSKRPEADVERAAEKLLLLGADRHCVAPRTAASLCVNLASASRVLTFW